MNKYKIRTFTCAGCGETVTGHFPQNRQYCSADCYEKSPRPERKTGYTANCEYCGDEFYLPLGRSKRAKHYFCCLDHQIAWQGRNKVEYTCKICGMVFKWSQSRQKENNPTYCSLECRDKDPDRYAMLRQMNLRQQELSPNGVELAGYQILDRLAIPYERQVLIADKFAVDAYLPEYRIIIQFDGDYWHGNPEKFQALDHRQDKRIRIDKSQNAYFAKCGYTVLRFWESDIKKRPDWVTEQIKLHLSLAY